MRLTKKLGLATAAASLAIAPVMAQSAAAQTAPAWEMTEEATGAAIVIGGLVLIAAGIFIADRIDDDNEDVPVSP